jgi:CHAT domain-containing protein
LLGDLAGALELEEHVHAARERLLPPDHPGLLSAKQNLAVTNRLLGDLAGALELDEYVHAARERLLPPDHPDLLGAKQNLALTRYALGDLAGALELTRSLLASQLAVVTRLRGESPRVARSAAGGELQRLSSALFLSHSGTSGDPEDGEERAGPEPALFAVLENLRAVSTSSSEVALAAVRHPQLGELRARIARARGALSDHVAAVPEDAEALEAWRKGIVELADDRDRVERELRAGLAERGVVFAEIDAGTVARGLEGGAVLVSFFRYTRYAERDPETGETPPAVDSLLAFVVTPDARVRRVEVGPAAPLEELVERWRTGIGTPVQRGVSVVASADEGDVGRELRAALVDPCLAVLEERPRVLHVVLDDFLHLVPLGALPGLEEEILADELDLRLLSSVARLVAPARPLGKETLLLALGGIDFDAQGAQAESALLAAAATPPVGGLGGSGERAGRPESLMPLLQTRFEVESVAALHEMLVEGERMVLTKGAATKAALVEAAPRARYLHLATHGWFAPESVTSTIDAREREDASAPALGRSETTVQGFAPETLCGLALAGANRGLDALGKAPGIATAEEIAALDLSNCELAVLSACETNVGLRRAGQGIQSLQGALHAAGARTAITSLWKVDDAATRQLFELFYTGLWDEGLGAGEALLRAQKRLREAGHPARDWAAWVLSGEVR